MAALVLLAMIPSGAIGGFSPAANTSTTLAVEPA